MIFWFILKTYPSLAEFTGLLAENSTVRYCVYAACAVGSIAVACTSQRVYKSWQGMFFGVAFFLFAAIWVYHGLVHGYWADGSETTLTLRGLFLALLLPQIALRNETTRCACRSILLGYIGLMQVGNFLSALGVVAPADLARNLDITAQRIAGLYMGPWHVGYSAIVALGVTLIAAKLTSSRSAQFLLYLAAIVSVINLFFSINRANLPAASMILVAWVIEKTLGWVMKRRRSSRQMLRIVAVSALATVATIILVVRYRSTILAYANLWGLRLDELSDQTVRWSTLVAGNNMFKAHPITGVGWDAAAQLSAEYGGPDDFTVHNVFIQAAAEGGFIGLSFCLIVFVALPLAFVVELPRRAGRLVPLGTWAAMIFFNTIASNLHLESHWDWLFFLTLLTLHPKSTPRARRTCTLPNRHQVDLSVAAEECRWELATLRSWKTR